MSIEYLYTVMSVEYIKSAAMIHQKKVFFDVFIPYEKYEKTHYV